MALDALVELEALESQSPYSGRKVPEAPAVGEGTKPVGEVLFLREANLSLLQISTNRLIADGWRISGPLVEGHGKFVACLVRGDALA